MLKRLLPLLTLAVLTQLTFGDRRDDPSSAILARVKAAIATNSNEVPKACKEVLSTHQIDLILWCIANCHSPTDLDHHLRDEPDSVFKARLVSAILRSSDYRVWNELPPPSIMNLANTQAISAMWDSPSAWHSYYAPQESGFGGGPGLLEMRMAATCIEAALKKYLPNEDFVLEYDDFYYWRDPGLTYGTHGFDPVKEARKVRFWRRFMDHSSRLGIAERLDKALAADKNGK